MTKPIEATHWRCPECKGHVEMRVPVTSVTCSGNGRHKTKAMKLEEPQPVK